MEAKKENETFKILSLDGGGIKGLFAISVLAKIEEKLNIKCSDEFDMFAVPLIVSNDENAAYPTPITTSMAHSAIIR